MFSPDGTLISASAAPHCGEGVKERVGSADMVGVGETVVLEREWAGVSLKYISRL